MLLTKWTNRRNEMRYITQTFFVYSIDRAPHSMNNFSIYMLRFNIKMMIMSRLWWWEGDMMMLIEFNILNLECVAWITRRHTANNTHTILDYWNWLALLLLLEVDKCVCTLSIDKDDSIWISKRSQKIGVGQTNREIRCDGCIRSLFMRSRFRIRWYSVCAGDAFGFITTETALCISNANCIFNQRCWAV